MVVVIRLMKRSFNMKMEMKMVMKKKMKMKMKMKKLYLVKQNETKRKI